MPLISAIVPNYNYARYLKERVRSILGQSLSDIELIYEDDASTDDSNRLVRAFSNDDRLRIRAHRKNSGRVYRRWNDGARQARGEWLWFAGADDSAHPRFVERLLEAARDAPEVGIVHGCVARVDASGRLIAERWHGNGGVMRHLERPYVWPGYCDALLLTEGCFLMTASGLLIRADAFREAGGFDDRLRQTADWNLYFNILRRRDIAFTPDAVAYYRIHDSAVTSTTGGVRRILEELYCVADAWSWLRDDARVSVSESAIVERRVKSRLYDLFAGGEFEIPADLRFAAGRIYEVTGEGRLRVPREESGPFEELRRAA